MSQPITITSNDFSAIYTHIYMTMAKAHPTILNNKYISNKLDMQNRHHYYSSSADHCGSAHDRAVDKKNKAVIMSTRSGTSKGVKLSTDPQSVAARERRHRISDRFKILQSMVPGGTRMDTVSMLDEAIHYVKFLKTQIWLHQAIFNNNNNVVKDFNPEQQMLLISNHVNTAGNVTDHQLYGSNLEGPSLACYRGDDGVELSSE